jgi:hypothetical protein
MRRGDGARYWQMPRTTVGQAVWIGVLALAVMLLTCWTTLGVLAPMPPS